MPKRDTIIVDRCDRASAAHRLRQRSPAHPSSPQHCCYGCRALGPSRSCPAVERVAANVSIVPGCVRKGMAWRGGAHLVAGSPRRRPRSRRAPRAPTSSAPSSQRSPSTLRIALRWQKVLPHSTARSISQETFEGAKGPQACTRSIRSMSYGARGSGGRSEQRESGVHLPTDCGNKPGMCCWLRDTNVILTRRATRAVGERPEPTGAPGKLQARSAGCLGVASSLVRQQKARRQRFLLRKYTELVTRDTNNELS